MTTSSLPTPTGEAASMPSFPSSMLKNSTADVLDEVLASGAVVITRHDKEKAVILSVETYRRLVASDRDDLDALREKFDGLLEKMQARTARGGARRAYGASPAEMGRAAVRAARRRG
ncbi:MAG: type II toxin-antitoxin system Phd/YefM family antitoxin [Planctomycetes bacterium]|nr:type II toxin-antitoxin system Phd/YefM family antitoxin [Planctomycetota bacterium]